MSSSKAPTTLPTPRLPKPRCGDVATSTRGRWRAASLILVHVVVLIHIAHWKVTGSTLTPVEPSEAMQTLELGYVNAGFILFVGLLLLTIVVGRFFCGWACHVVAYQDACAWLLKKVGLRPHPVRSRVLVLVPFAAAFYMFAWPQVERMIAGSAGPAWVWHLKTDVFWATFPGPWIAALTLLVDGALVVWLLGAKGFCTYGCPYGALFGIADRVAPGKIRVTESCEQCGHCSQTCTSNVRVHEEVAKFGMVVDTGCMKCMDCVTVCPKDALYFGFSGGAPKAKTPPKRMRPRRVYDFSLGEEVLLSVAAVVGVYAFRGLYHAVPFLLSLGLAVMTAIGAVLAWRLSRRPDVSIQNHVLKAGGRLSGGGFAAATVLLSWFGFAGHSAFVQFETREGLRLRESITMSVADYKASKVVAAKAIPHLRRADRWGLFEDATLLNALGSCQRLSGDSEGAIATLRRAIAIDPTVEKHLALSTLLMLEKDLAGARAALEEVLRLDPENDEARRRLAVLDRE